MCYCEYVGVHLDCVRRVRDTVRFGCFVFRRSTSEGWFDCFVRECMYVTEAGTSTLSGSTGFFFLTYVTSGTPGSGSIARSTLQLLLLPLQTTQSRCTAHQDSSAYRVVPCRGVRVIAFVYGSTGSSIKIRGNNSSFGR